MIKIKKGYILKTIALIITLLFFYNVLVYAAISPNLRVPIGNYRRLNEVKSQKVLSDNIRFLTDRLSNEKIPDFILSDGKTEILLSEHPDYRALFRVYIREGGEWRKIRPLVQDAKPEIDLNIAIITGKKDIILDVLDLGISPPDGAIDMIYHWASYMAKYKGGELAIGSTQNPRLLTLLSKVTDFSYDIEFLKGAKLLVGKQDTPVKIDYRPGRRFGFTDGQPDGYVVTIYGKFETWLPIYKKKVFEGWEKTTSSQEYKMSELRLGEKGLLTTYKGEVIGQVLAFPGSVRAAGNPMPEKGGFLNISILTNVQSVKGVLNLVGINRRSI